MTDTMTGSRVIMFNLRDLLSYAEISQKEFAMLIGSSTASVSRYLSGERSPSVMTIIKICKAFPAFSPNDFLFEDGVKKKTELKKMTDTMTGSRVIMFNLRDLLSYAEISQKEFAMLIGSSTASVSRYLSGERSPSVMTIIKICKAFPAFSPNDFIFEDGVKKKTELIKLDNKFNRKK